MKRSKRIVDGTIGVALCLLLGGCVPVPIPGKIQVSPEVHGRVIDQTTRQPVPGATVMLKEDVETVEKVL